MFKIPKRLNNVQLLDVFLIKNDFLKIDPESHGCWAKDDRAKRYLPVA